METNHHQIVIQIQICHRCKEHAWNSKHDQENYITTFQQFRKQLTEKNPKIKVTKSFSSDKHIGAFEIRSNGIFLYSKLKTHTFPNHLIITKILNFANDYFQNKDISIYDIKHENQTSVKKQLKGSSKDFQKRNSMGKIIGNGKYQRQQSIESVKAMNELIKIYGGTVREKKVAPKKQKKNAQQKRRRSVEGIQNQQKKIKADEKINMIRNLKNIQNRKFQQSKIFQNLKQKTNKKVQITHKKQVLQNIVQQKSPQQTIKQLKSNQISQIQNNKLFREERQYQSKSLQQLKQDMSHHKEEVVKQHQYKIQQTN